MKTKGLIKALQSNFLAGLAIVLPMIISIGVLYWLFGTVSNFTDALLFFLPRHWTHYDHGVGPLRWYWSLCALLLAISLTCLVGQLARYYIGRQVIQLTDTLLLRVPLLNKIYATLKQVNEAFGSGSKSSFKQVVLVEFPQPGQYAMGFITGEQPESWSAKNEGRLYNIFIPTTPNPTSGFIILMPESKFRKLDISVSEGIKFIISLGSISPDFTGAKPAPATTRSQDL
jgi:uncharacterized membrane protein